ncbi:MAG: PorP/SprF family type IX secretion system membrane protein [Flavobacteriales bacterium]|nr:PorP/SprF family type IX secretion system membrane protein [Flavobacteriales bacterium]
MRHLILSIAIASLSLGLSIPSQGQDIHFSQFFLTDLSTDPSLTGRFDSDYRISGVHRVQWRSVTLPYSTFQFTADAHDFQQIKGLGLGLRIMNDRAGDSRFNTFSMAALISKATPMDDEGRTELRSGLSIGFTQKRIDFDALRFDAQYDGTLYDASLSDGELLRGDKVSHLDVHAGLSVIRYQQRGRMRLLGLSIWNLSTPDVSFKQDVSVFLRQRHSVYGEYSVGLDDNWDIIPSGRMMWQGPYQEYLLGTRIRHTWEYSALAKRRAYIGALARWNDGAYICFGFERDEWIFGMSYDVNLSPLEVASRNRGALELTAIYLMDVFREERVLHRKCLRIL